MSAAPGKPLIFISYSHKDEPEHPSSGEVQWLSFVRTYLQPAVKHGVFDIWVDKHMPGGTDWDPEIETKLRKCDIFILLVSANSMASDYIVDKEIAIIRDRQAKGDPVHFYPLLLTPTLKAGLVKVHDKNLRPRDAKPFSGYSVHDRAQRMTDVANEIADLVAQLEKPQNVALPSGPRSQRTYVHITGLPETAYQRLVGRDAELTRLDEVWADHNTNILSLVAEGGAGKSALVNEWVKRLQGDNYRDAETMLGWSFYSQGTKERAASAEEFLNWAVEKLGIELEATGATAKAEAVADAMMGRRVLLVLDGVEPLQHGPDGQLGLLKDQGLRMLLRRFAATPPGAAHSLIVLTSRLAVKDIAHWQDGAAPVVDVERLSDEAGAALLRDNGVWGTDENLETTARDFGGHPLALELLAGFLKETQFGDVRRRDRIRGFLSDLDNPRHDHARRVLDSYEKEWLADQPAMLAIMHMVGLFDRPASTNCLQALRAEPVVVGLTDRILGLDGASWQRAVARLRDARLLPPLDPIAPDALDAHPLVREWFGERLRQTSMSAWQAAHGRLYEYLRDTTKEGDQPDLKDLGPLYQAIAHGCRAGRHQDALDQVYVRRICRGDEFYASTKLGANGSNLAAISWFFDRPYEALVAGLIDKRQPVMNEVALYLRAQGRLTDALPVQRALLLIDEQANNWLGASIAARNLSEAELVVGDIPGATRHAETAVEYTKRAGDVSFEILARSSYGTALQTAGQRAEAFELFADAERRQRQRWPDYPLLYFVSGHQYCDLLLAKGDWVTVRDRATQTRELARRDGNLASIALDELSLGRAQLGLALTSEHGARNSEAARELSSTAYAFLGRAAHGLRLSERLDYLPKCLLAQATFHRSTGDWAGAARDLDEVEEIAEPGPMRIFLCDMALERARLAFARIEAFAPLNGMIDGSLPKRELPDTTERHRLYDDAEEQLRIAENYIQTCGYRRRDEELAELQAVLRGERAFASLPPRV